MNSPEVANLELIQRNRKLFILTLFLIAVSSFFIQNNTMAQQTKHFFKVEVKKNVTLESYFLLYLPEGYDSLDQTWPLLLFLHGIGERGDMIELVKKQGPPKLIEYGRKFPFIVVSPQCPEDSIWSVPVLDMVLTEMVQRYKVDTTRIYVTGLSMGGTGTWQLAEAYPHRFAAIVPVCAEADPSKAYLIKDLPVWVFHGAKDDIHPLSESENMVNALKALGSPVKFTIYPEAGHDSWTDAYNDEEMWKWLMEQKK
jgi:predicted peptidase